MEYMQYAFRAGRPAHCARYLPAALFVPLVAAAIFSFSGCAPSNAMRCPTKDPKVAAQMLRENENLSDYEKFLLAKLIYAKEDATQALLALKGMKNARETHEKVRRELERAVEGYGSSAQKLQLAAWRALMVLKKRNYTFSEEDACVDAIVRSGDLEIAKEALKYVFRPRSKQVLDEMAERNGVRTGRP